MTVNDEHLQCWRVRERGTRQTAGRGIEVGWQFATPFPTVTDPTLDGVSSTGRCDIAEISTQRGRFQTDPFFGRKDRV